MKFINNYLEELGSVLEKFDKNSINSLVKNLKNLKKSGGRLFIIGVGGSAGNASHAVNDFRKICEIECYTRLIMFQMPARTNMSWEIHSSLLRSQN